MKKLIARYWGIALVLALLIGLLVPAAPVSAGDTAWSTVATPSTTGSKLTAATSVDFLLMAADGKTMFLYDNVNFQLRKSTDSGLTWTSPVTAPMGVGLPAAAMMAMAISSGFATDNTLVATDGAIVYMSTDGGANFFTPIALAAPVLPLRIVALAVGPDYLGGTKVLIGTADHLGGGNMYAWTSRNFVIEDQRALPAPILAANWLPAGDVLAVAFSPNFLADGELLAFVASAVVAPATSSTMTLNARLAGNGWNVSTRASTIPTVVGTNLTDGGAMKVVLDFGADYDFSGNPYVLIGLNGTTPNAAVPPVNVYDDVYRARIGTAASQAADLNVQGAGTATSVFSLDTKGNLADGSAYAGVAGGGVYKGTTITGTPTWSTSAGLKGPSGASIIVKVAANGLVAGSTGLAAAVGSAVSLSTDDNNTYSQVSMISYTILATAQITDFKVVDSNTMFLLLEEAAGTYGVVFKTADGGVTWNGVFNGNGIFGVFPSPKYATDNTVYVPQDNLTIRKSVNGGSTYSTALVGGTAPVSAFAAADGTNFYVASAGGLFYKAGRFVNFANIGVVVSSVVIASNGDIVVGTVAGTALRSVDDGLTFAPLAGLAGGGPVVIALDSAYATSKIVYAGTPGGVSRYTAVWTVIDTTVVDSAADVAISNDGNLYYAGAVAGAGVRRGLNPTMITNADQGWDAIVPAAPWTAATNVTKLQMVSSLISGTAFVHDIYALVSNQGIAVPYPYTYRIFVYSDKLTNPLTLTAPTANGVVSTTQIISWGAYPGLPAGVLPRYEVQLASDAAFLLPVGATGPALGTQWVGAPLVPGFTYYVRARVSAGFPLLSNWSAPVKFSVKLVQSGNDITGGINSGIAPAPGAVGVAVKPAFSWALVDRAVSYNLQVADNPVFVNPLDNQTGLNTNVWLETKTLDPGKTYYWRVQAVAADGTVSDWFPFTFTTAVPVPTAPTPTVSVTVTAAPQPPITLPAVTVTQTPAPAPKFFDPASGLYFNTQAELQQYQAQHATPPTPATPAYIWVIIIIAAVLVIAVIVLIARTRRV